MIGSLKHRITFQQLVSEVNANGFETEEWQEKRTVWAKVLNLSGKEYFAAATINKENTVKFIVRFIKDIDESMRVKFNDTQYNIASINNIKYENKYIEIRAMEVEDCG